MKMTSKRKALPIYLNPAEIVMAEDPVTVTTVLGSCVAVTLYSPRTRLGAICHGVLPYGLESDPGKYVNQAVRHMLNFFREKQIESEELVAKVFGGADMFPRLRNIRSDNTIGTQNINAALSELKQAGITPFVVEVSGEQGRKLVFFSDTGDVYIKRVQRFQMQKTEQTLTGKKRKTKHQPVVA